MEVWAPDATDGRTLEDEDVTPSPEVRRGQIDQKMAEVAAGLEPYSGHAWEVLSAALVLMHDESFEALKDRGITRDLQTLGYYQGRASLAEELLRAPITLREQLRRLAEEAQALAEEASSES